MFHRRAYATLVSNHRRAYATPLAMIHLLDSHHAVCREARGEFRTGHPLPLAVLPGSFNPLHHGHTTLAAVAAAQLGVPVAFELSVTNVDKPELVPDEVERRIGQFAGVGDVWVTRAAGIMAKASLFPGAAFVLGWDTAVRLIDPKYYSGERGRDACLRKLRERGCVVVVGGRVWNGAFQTWTGDGIADEFHGLFVALTEDDFRADVSSTALREMSKA